MKTTDELLNFYYTKLASNIHMLEEERLQIRDRVTIFNYIFFILNVITIAFIAYLAAVIKPHLFKHFFQYYIFTGFIIYLLIIRMLVGDYKLLFKVKLIAPLIKEIDETLVYKPQAKIDEKTFMNSQIFMNNLASYTGDDLVTGKLGSVDISFSDIVAKKLSLSSTGGSEIAFQGLFLVTSFNKYFSSSTIILPDKAEKIYGSLVGQWLQSNNLKRDELIKMDYPEFEKEFVVYGNNQIEARYILTHSMMERILNLKKKTGKALYMSFVNGHMYLATEYHKDLFRAQWSRSPIESNIAMEYIKTVKFVLAIVEELKLNQKLWSKR